MRRAALGVALGLALASCRPAGPAPGPAPRPAEGLPREEPLVRIGLAVDTASFEVGASGPMELVPEGGRAVRAEAGTVWTVSADPAGRLVAQGGGRTVGPVSGTLTLRPAGDGAVTIGGRSYRGAALVRPVGPGRLTVINALDLEAYLRGVVPLEIGKRTEAEVEAVKAQAVAARTYTISRLGRRERMGFDLYATVADQVYGGLEAEDPVASRAVRETAGEILTYRGEPIEAYYHSTCGEQTAAIEDAWPWSEPVPYLRSVSDRIPGTDRYYNDLSNRFHWTQRWSGDVLEAILARTLPDYTRRPDLEVGRIESVEMLSRNESGRVGELRIVAGGRPYVVRGDSIRWVLRPEPGRILNSALLYDVVQEREGGRVSALELRGGGWGHGIGMCQWGVIGRARAGQRYREILKTYYTGVDVADLY